jgi:hypothetical protein
MQDGHDNNSLVFQVGLGNDANVYQMENIIVTTQLGTDNTFINQYGTANNAWTIQTGDNHLSTVNQ